MKLSRERKAYAGMLVLGLLALGADRFIIGPPATAGADEYSVDPADAAADTGAAPAPFPLAAGEPAPRTQAVSMGQRLQSFEAAGADQELTDLFQVPRAWRPAEQASGAPRPVQPSGLSPWELFKRRKLNGVLVEATGQGRRQAIVDGQAILLGHSLEGFRLIDVTQKTAVFEGHGRQVVLQVIEQPPVRGSMAGAE